MQSTDPNNEMSQALAQARQDIARIDSQILALIGARQKTAQRIGELKRCLHIPVEDGRIERRVFRRNRLYGRSCGLAPAAVSALTRLLIELAKEKQSS